MAIGWENLSESPKNVESIAEDGQDSAIRRPEPSTGPGAQTQSADGHNSTFRPIYQESPTRDQVSKDKLFRRGGSIQTILLSSEEIEKVTQRGEARAREGVKAISRPFSWRTLKPYPNLVLCVSSVLLAVLSAFFLIQPDKFAFVAYIAESTVFLFLMALISLICAYFGARGDSFFQNCWSYGVGGLLVIGLILLLMLHTGALDHKFAALVGMMVFSLSAATWPLPIRLFRPLPYVFIGGPAFYLRFWAPLTGILLIWILFLVGMANHVRQIGALLDPQPPRQFAELLAVPGNVANLEPSQLSQIKAELNQISGYAWHYHKNKMSKLQTTVVEYILDKADNGLRLSSIPDAPLYTFNHYNNSKWKDIKTQLERLNDFTSAFHPLTSHLTGENTQIIQNRITEYLKTPFTRPLAFYLDDIFNLDQIPRAEKSPKSLIKMLATPAIPLSQDGLKRYVNVLQLAKSDGTIGIPFSMTKNNTVCWESLFLFDAIPGGKNDDGTAKVLLRRIVDKNSKGQHAKNNEIWLFFKDPLLEKEFITTLRSNNLIAANCFSENLTKPCESCSEIKNKLNSCTGADYNIQRCTIKKVRNNQTVLDRVVIIRNR